MGTMGDQLAIYTTQSEISSFYIDKIGQIWVSSYGAVGDGEADDTIPVQNAIDAAIAAGLTEVYFTGGKTYLINTLTNTSGITFIGDNVTITGTSGIEVTSLSSHLAEYTNFTRQSFVDVNRAKLYELLTQINKVSGTVTGVGDSITAGTQAGIPWYNPMVSLFTNITFFNKGVGGDTSKEVLARVGDIASTDADLYLIAVGCNDVRYQDGTSSLTPAEYVTTMTDIISALGADKCVCINPWPAFNGDTSSVLDYYRRDKLTDDFTRALSKYCFENDIPFIETNKNLRSAVDLGNQTDMVISYIHPNADVGVPMYCNEVLYGNVKGYNYGITKTEAQGEHLYRIEVLSPSNSSGTNSVLLKRLYTDQTIQDIYTDNYRSDLSDPTVLLDPYDSSNDSRFGNIVDGFPFNITFSTNEPITELWQLQEGQELSTSNFDKLIGRYRIYYSSEKEAIADIGHPSWKLKYESLDTEDSWHNLLYVEPNKKMEERVYYWIKISATNATALKIKSLLPDQKILAAYGYNFNTISPQIFVMHESDALTDPSSTAILFFSTNRPITELNLDFTANGATFDYELAMSKNFGEFNTDWQDSKWSVLTSDTGISDSSALSITVP